MSDLFTSRLFNENPLDPIPMGPSDTDFYKEPMFQVMHKKYRDVKVQWGFTNRNLERNLGEHINPADYLYHINAYRNMPFTKTDEHYLRGTNEYQERMFEEGFIQARKKAQNEIPEPNVWIDENNRFNITCEGLWPQASLIEIPTLYIMSELNTRAQVAHLSQAEKFRIESIGYQRNLEKQDIIKKYPDLGIVLFDTRRRPSGRWQEFLTVNAVENLGHQLIGTSNTFLAQKYGLLPMGTDAHERNMVLVGLAGKDEQKIHEMMDQWLRDWWDQYGEGLSIALADTYGLDAFFRAFAPYAKDWKGVRQDSGNPFEFANKVIKYYESLGINPKDKMIIFSDGLTLDLIIKLHEEFKGKIKTSFGWGTNWVYDFGGIIKPMSIVMKAWYANGFPLCKLTENIAKAICQDPSMIPFYQKVFGYDVVYKATCLV